MGKELKNIEDLFKSSFEGQKIEPSEKVWSNINTKLKFAKYGSSKFLGSIAAVVAVAVLSVFLSSVNDKNQSLADHSNSTSKSKIEQSINKETQQIKNQNIIISEVETGSKLQLSEMPTNKLISKHERETDLAPVIESKSIKVISQNDKNSLNIKKALAPSPKFRVKTQVGCVPFKLELENLTKSAIAYEWSFGNGETSTEISPSYTYRYPGVYKVVLKAVGFGGVAITYIDSIVVHDSPEAQLNWPYESVIQTGQKITIPNKSENISEVEWNFGDRNYSDEWNGNHIFNKEGEYTIIMKVWSVNDCVDSAIINNIKVVDSKYRIAFPNAFTPNMDGASSGYYNKTDRYNDVFHPKVNTKISDYEIRIFSKAGIEIFKSNDVLYGWNGYYQNRLLPEGVYIYIVAGKFEGGQQFYDKGNITVLHRK